MIIGIVLTLFALGLIIFANITKDGYLSDGWVAVLIPTSFVALVFLFTGMACSLESISAYAEIEAYSDIKQLYQESIKSTADAVVQLEQAPLAIEQIAALIDVGISVENLQHSTLTASRIKEARDYQRKITEKRYYYRRITRNWFLRTFVAEPPKSLFE